jgi:hypothetical protein
MHPTRNRDKDLADAIALEQIRSQNRIREIKAAQGGVVQPPTPSRKNRQVISVAETKADVFGKSVPGLRREIARIAPGGGMGVARSARGGDSDYKVTGTSIFNRPDDESVWRDDLNQWIRPWLPGEKEAEALRRTGEVQNDLVAERELTAQGRREREALVNDVVDAIKQGRFSREEMPKLLERFGDAEDTIRMADALREREPTAQERFDKGIVMDERGNRFYQKANGDYVPLPDPAAEAQEAEAQRQESERQKLEAEQAKAAQKREADRQKYIDKAIDRAQSDKYADDPPTIDDLKKIQEQAGMEYDELHPIQPAMSPTPSGEVQPVTEPTARKKKWGGFAD